MLEDNQIYVVVDVEADGPAVGMHSMLSLAAVATTATKEVSQFYRKLAPLPDATVDPDTMEWWQRHQLAWDEVQANRESPEKVMNDFCGWVDALNAEPIFVANPIGLDYTFVSYYLFQYANRNPFMGEKNAIRTLDIRSFIAGKYSLSFNNASRTKLPASLVEDMPQHTHRAIDDAVGYAHLLRKILALSKLETSTDYTLSEY